jgi:hypothetical protein
MTEIKKSENELKASEEKWRSLVENAPNIILITDKDGKETRQDVKMTEDSLNTVVVPFEAQEGDKVRLEYDLGGYVVRSEDYEIGLEVDLSKTKFISAGFSGQPSNYQKSDGSTYSSFGGADIGNLDFKNNPIVWDGNKFSLSFTGTCATDTSAMCSRYSTQLISIQGEYNPKNKTVTVTASAHRTVDANDIEIQKFTLTDIPYDRGNIDVDGVYMFDIKGPSGKNHLSNVEIQYIQPKPNGMTYVSTEWNENAYMSIIFRENW